MNRLWVQLSILFGVGILIAAAAIVGINIAVRRASLNDVTLIQTLATNNHVLDHLATYYEHSQTWDTAQAYLDGLAVMLPPTSNGNGYGFTLSDGRPAETPKTILILPIEVEKQIKGYLQIARMEVPSGPPPNDILLPVLGDLTTTVAIVGIVIGIPLGIFASRRLTAPLNRLAIAARQVGARQFEGQVPVTGSMEIAAVARAFNEMAVDLRHAEMLRRNMVADVAHELRTPLTIVQGGLRGILDDMYPADKTQIGQLYDQTRLLNRLVSDLRELSLAEAHQLQLNMQTVNLCELAQNTVDAFVPLAEEHDIQFTIQALQAIPNVIADSQRMSQVLHNLVANALRHSPVGSQITLQISQSTPNKVRLTVEDEGKGITSEHLQYIFERFYRIDSDRSRETGGSGLGLTIAQALVNAHGGSLSVYNKNAPDHGAVFSIDLPITRSPMDAVKLA